jgi:hypothetical protein
MRIVPSLKIFAVCLFTVKWTSNGNPQVVVSVKSTNGAGTITGGVAWAAPTTRTVTKRASTRPFERVIIRCLLVGQGGCKDPSGARRAQVPSWSSPGIHAPHRNVHRSSMQLEAAVTADCQAERPSHQRGPRTTRRSDNAPELRLMREWLDNWSGLGLIIAGMT